MNDKCSSEKSSSKTLPRVFSPILENRISLDEGEFHHLIHVLRKNVGDLVEVIDGKGGLAIGKVVSISKKGVELELSEITRHQPRGKPFFLVQAWLKNTRMDWLLEKAVELGVSGIWLFPGERSVTPKISEKQAERLEKEAISALKQSKNLFLPQILFLPPLTKWKSRPLGALFYGSLDEDKPHFLHLYHPWEKALMFIGPEGGFSDAEQALLDEWQAAAIRLHPHTLRAETAAIVALTFLSYLSH